MGRFSDFKPSYLKLLETGQLEKRADVAWKALASCTLCPHRCKVNRLEGERGFCKTGNQAVMASFGPHFGEEAPLVGTKGSGTVFFSWCNMRCVYCQNYDISHLGAGNEVTPEFLAFCFLSLQEDGCHNINLVSPSHVVPFFLRALVLAAGEGLHIPLVYNTGGYDALETLRLLDGVIDIYMPDFKYSDEAVAERYSKVPDYPSVAKKAIREMHRQVGDLEIGPEGLATRGLLVRHLVLPGDLGGTGEVLRFIAEEISRNTYLNLMDQYRPCGMAGEFPPLDRGVHSEEFRRALSLARRYGLSRLDPAYRRHLDL